MKKIVLTAAALTLTAGTALAIPTTVTTPGKIQNSKHDMNFTFGGGSNSTGEICIYCHTPHNASLAVPLWNRANPSDPNAFSLYKSPTLTSAAAKAKLEANSISLFCMSCHDGVTGLGSAVYNRNNVTANSYGILGSQGVTTPGGTVVPTSAKTNENANLGYDLTTTHPIGFSFTGVHEEDAGIFDKDTILANFKAGARKAQTVNGINIAAATDAQNFLYGPQGDRFECASCHRVHDPGTSGNFLRVENYQSKLCLSCHNK